MKKAVWKAFIAFQAAFFIFIDLYRIVLGNQLPNKIK